jgi:hypothetical protein
MTSMLGDLRRRFKYGKAVVLVSGLPRSGTSMAMKMLAAGGMETIVDNIRSADEDNPKGYFEDERVKDLAEMEDKTWLRDARGKVIKVVSSLLQYLPQDNLYKVIFMRRNLHEVLQSQAKMLERRGETSDTSDEEMVRMYESHLDKVQFQLKFREWFDVLYLDFADVVADPESAASAMNDFLGGGLDVRAMAMQVDPDLYRNRSETSTGIDRR